MKNEGFSSLEYLITLIVLSILIAAFGIFLRTASIIINKKTDIINDRQNIDKILDEIFMDIKSDSASESDSKMDRVWKWNESEKDGYEIKITSLSGLINLNYLPSEILENSELKLFFDDAEAINFIRDYHKQGKMLYQYKELEDFITEEKFNKYFTFYGYANINTCDEEILKLIADGRTNSSYGNEIYNKARIIKENRQLIQNDIEFKMFLGINYDDMFPYINIRPSLNVNLIEEETLRALISYPGFKVKNISNAVNTVISLRESRKITEDDITNIFGISKNDELYYYLGCRTWVWQIDVTGKNTSCKVVLVRSYEDDAFGKTDYYILEKKWI